MSAVSERIEAGTGTFVANDHIYSSLAGFVIRTTDEQGLVIALITVLTVSTFIDNAVQV